MTAEQLKQVMADSQIEKKVPGLKVVVEEDEEEWRCVATIWIKGDEYCSTLHLRRAYELSASQWRRRIDTWLVSIELFGSKI